MTDQITIARTPTTVANNFRRLVDKRKEIVQNAAIQKEVTNIESMVLAAGCAMPIASMSLEDFKRESVKGLRDIAREVGITYWSSEKEMKPRIESLMKYLAAFHRDMSFADIRLAFDLSIEGRLDEFLPSNSKGEPETKHFQDFGKEYVGRILKAYKRLKQATWSKANNLVPEEIEKVSDEDRKIYRQTFLEDIFEQFEEYKNEKRRPRFLVPSLVLKELKKAGIVEGHIEVTEDHITKGFIRMTQDDNLSTFQKTYYAKQQEKGEVSGAVESRAIKCAFEDYVVKAFDAIIEADLEIRDLL